MPGLRSTGALWLDLVLLGVGFLALLLLFPLVLVTNPRQASDPTLIGFVTGFTVVGVATIALGVVVGRRTRWKIPDPATR